MRTFWCVIVGIMAMVACTTVGDAQYIYLDTNGDGLNTTADQISVGDTTTVDIWLSTNHNRNGSDATCSTEDGDLTFNSYALVLHAVGGSITWGDYENLISSFDLAFTSGSSATDLFTGFGSATALEPGLYHLGSVRVTVLDGTPGLEFATHTDLYGPSLTGFGAACSGVDGDNTLKLGTDWFDADGAGSPGQEANRPPTLVGPTLVSVPEGGVLTLTATASDPDASDRPVVSVQGLPDGFTTTTTSNSSETTLSAAGRLPSGSTSQLSLVWTASDGVTATVSDTTTVDVTQTESVALPPSYGYAPSRVLVRFHPGVITVSPSDSKTSVGDVSFSTTQTPSLLATAGIANLQRLLPGFTHASVNATTVTGEPVTLPEDLTDLYVADLVDTNVIAAVSILKADSTAVMEVEPDFVGLSCDGRAGQDAGSLKTQSDALGAGALSTTTIPNDSLFAWQWGLRNTGQYFVGVGPDIRAYLAWDATIGGSTSVGVLSTGAQFNHPDVSAGDGGNFVGGSTANDDDPLSAGTAAAGVICAHGNNTHGVAGVSWRAGVSAIKVLDSNGAGTESSFLQGLDRARQYFLPTILTDVHFLSGSNNMAAGLKNAQATGMLIVAPTGNDDLPAPYWPASYTRLTEGVGAVQENGQRWSNAHDIICPTPDGLGSPYGPQVHLSAPGGNRIVTTRTTTTGSYYGPNRADGCYKSWRSGTTGAGAFVAGTAALVQTYGLAFTGEDLGHVLELTAQDKGDPGWDEVYGYGILDAAAAINFIDNARVIDRGIATNTTDIGVVDTPQITMWNVPGLTPAQYSTEKHEIRANVTFATPFVSPPTVWGRNATSIGWRSHANGSSRYHLEETAGWAEVVPGTVTRLGCTLRTFVYRVSGAGGNFIGWFPTQSGAKMDWTAVGPANATGVEMAQSPKVLRVAPAPNPVVRNGEFSLSLPRSGHVTLRLFRADGALVRTLVDSKLEAGIHHVAWSTDDSSGRKLSTGMYFYQLSTDYGRRNGKVVVVR